MKITDNNSLTERTKMKLVALLFLTILTFTSCEEIIELDLNSTNPAIIIEANLTNSLNDNFVKITQSTDFYNPGTYKTISNAEITIRDNQNNIYILEEISPGLYLNNELTATPENQYTIEVNSQNKKYIAESFAPKPIVIDSLSYSLETRPFNKNKKVLELHVYFQDNPEQEDYAKFDIYKNGEKINNIFLYNDRLTNGNYIDYFFFNFRDEEFKSGDKILVEMKSIDEQTDTYFKTLRNALTRNTRGPFGSTAPANPTTNWSNNAFGYFSAFTISADSIVLK